MFKDNPEGQTQYDLPSGDSTEEMRREFDKAGYWPNEVMWKAWQQSWNAAIAIKQAELNAAIAPKQAELDAVKTDAANWKEEALRLGGLNAKNIGEAKEQIRKLKSELEDANAMNLVGTQQCIYTDVSNALKQSNTTIAALEAKIVKAGANYFEMEAWKLAGEDIFNKCALSLPFYLGAWWADRPWRNKALTPPITSERELELLADAECVG